MLSAAEIMRLLDLKPHPEGGHFRETFRDPRMVDGGRAASTAAYYLLARGERSHWHKVDAVEVWHYHAGAPLKLEIALDSNGPVECLTLGADLAAGERPQAMVPTTRGRPRKLSVSGRWSAAPSRPDSSSRPSR
jgi:uncharacterized protein